MKKKYKTQLWYQLAIIVIMLLIGRLNSSHNLFRSINLIGCYLCSSNSTKLDILSSQFHAQGVKHFQKSRLLNRQSTTAIFDIDKLITELEKQRLKIKDLKQSLLINNDQELAANGQCSKYFDLYGKLSERMKDVKINEEWGYRIVGWYNLQPFLDHLIEELLDKTNKVDHNNLIESISWMKPHQLIISPSDSVQEMIKHKGKIDNFYRQLIVGHSVDMLRVIESIFEQAFTNAKGKYYQHYLISNVDQILDSASKNDKDISNMLWILEMYVITFNDDPQIIQKFEQYFLRTKLLERKDVVTTFIKVYNQMGRTNPQIYQLYIKPYIKKAPANVIQLQILNLQFLIHSEINDEEILNQTLKNIARIARTQSLADSQRLHIHYLLHYLKIKGIKFQFPFQLFRQFSEVCRTFEQDGTFAKTIAIQLDEKSRREGVDYYNSSCLLKKKQLDTPSKAKQGEPIKKVEGFKKFTDIKFCCLNIDFCVYNEAEKKGTILEKNYHRFNQSGRLIRIQEVKAQLLEHYGLAINYLETKNEINKRLEK